MPPENCPKCIYLSPTGKYDKESNFKQLLLQAEDNEVLRMWIEVL